MFEDGTEREYRVVGNEEEQYSIWPANHALPPGWQVGGKAGTKAECLAFIKQVWTDLRPRSVREGQPTGGPR
jgi:MbtH protein